MIQSLKAHIRWPKKIIIEYSIAVLLIFCIISIITYFEKLNPYGSCKVSDIISYIIGFAGITSAIIITFLVSKTIQIRQEKLEKLKEIISLSNKVKNIQRIALYLTFSRQYWEYNTYEKMRVKYSKLHLFHIKEKSFQNPIKIDTEIITLLNEFNAEKDSLPGCLLFLELRALISDDFGSISTGIHDNYNHDELYPIDILEKWHYSEIGYHLWFCFEENVDNFKSHFHLDKKIITNKVIESLIHKIYPKEYKREEISYETLARLGVDLDIYYIPRLYSLTKSIKEGLPESIQLSFRILISTILFGLFIPLLFSSFYNDSFVLTIVSKSCVIILILIWTYYAFQLKEILTSEVDVYNYWNNLK